MYPVTTVDAGVDGLPATSRFDPRRHLRIPGLFDLWLEPGPRGGLVVPTEPSSTLDARGIADLVRRSGESADDVRILTGDGARNLDLFSDVAGLLGHDVLVSPDGAEIRHRRRADAGAGPLHAVPLDRVTRRPMDWLVIQPPDLATPLPSWFAVDRGVVRPRTGVVGLPLPAGLALATRADFVTRRATAHRFASTPDGLITVAVTARSAGFLVGDYGGTQKVHGGEQLAALLGDLPLYGSDLRLWVTWPSDPQEQQGLAEQAREFAERTGATVWTPPPGGSAELVDGGHDLRALDPAGSPAEWQAHRPRSAAGPLALRATPDGLLVPALARPSITVSARLAAPLTAPPSDGRRDPVEGPVTVPAKALPRPVLITEGRRAPGYGPAWLPPGQQVNAEEFEAFVVCPVDPARAVAEGVPSAELFLIALLDPVSVPDDSHLLRVRVAAGGAIPMATLRSHIPARLQHLRGVNDAYLLPAARLDRVSPLGGFRTYRFGRLIATAECLDGALRIHCSSRSRTIAGLPNDVRRWPGVGTRRAYLLVPASGSRLPRGWLRLHRKAPPARPGRLMLEVGVPRGRTIDVTSTAAMLAPLSRVRNQAERLRAAGVELIVGSRSYERVQVRRVYLAQENSWRRVPGTEAGPLPAVLARVQSPVPT
ncbi:hypothetical protein ACIG87_29270 [Micromonospora sp. NPDC051925]|uniref:hypothetical protein n=1 Tax=Micromonospora sp. NPDC051925 TaxID=3364288 RepID=UPI0037C664DA